MKVVILAGGFGTRISEESHLKPKPMIEIDGRPILWHIMKFYSSYGFNDFIICAGYKQEIIKDYFEHYYIRNSDVVYDLSKGGQTIIKSNITEPWKVTIVDTGLNTMTGGRIKRIEKYTGGKPFMLTYGDGLSDVNLKELLKFHESRNKTVTITAVQQKGRFGSLEINNESDITDFVEKREDGTWINGGFMVVNPEVFDYPFEDDTIFEKDPMDYFVRKSELSAYKHRGFWKCMDTLRDKNEIEGMIRSKHAPWIRW